MLACCRWQEVRRCTAERGQRGGCAHLNALDCIRPADPVHCRLIFVPSHSPCKAPHSSSSHCVLSCIAAQAPAALIREGSLLCEVIGVQNSNWGLLRQVPVTR